MNLCDFTEFLDVLSNLRFYPVVVAITERSIKYMDKYKYNTPFENLGLD